MCMDLSLGFLFCSVDLYFCLCASTIRSWWLWLCSRAWSHAGWFLLFHSSFSRLLWLFEGFCISIQIMKLFILAHFLYTHLSLYLSVITGFSCCLELDWMSSLLPYEQMNTSGFLKYSKETLSCRKDFILHYNIAW